jgi:hypothetical protein
VLDDEADAPESAIALVGEMKILIPMAGLIDKDAELARLDKEIGKLRADIERIDKKLANPSFVDKAPAAVVQKERDRLNDQGAALADLVAQQTNVDAAEISKFEALAARWWDPDSEFKPLHDINPLRLGYVQTAPHGSPARRCWTWAAAAASCPSPWPSPAPRCWASTWARSRCGSPSCTRSRPASRSTTARSPSRQLADERPASFDVVTCMEMLEHVPDPAPSSTPAPGWCAPADTSSSRP